MCINLLTLFFWRKWVYMEDIFSDKLVHIIYMLQTPWKPWNSNSWFQCLKPSEEAFKSNNDTVMYLDTEVLSYVAEVSSSVYFVLQTKYEVWRARSWVRDCPPRRGWNLPWWQPVPLNRPVRSRHRWTSPTTRVWRTTTISKVGKSEKQGCLYPVQLIWNFCN